MLGEMSADHPRVRAAVLAEKRVRGRLYNELKTAIQNIDGELAMSHAKVQALNEQLQGYEGKFADLSDVRSRYSRLTKEVEQREKFIEQVETNLAVARSNRAAAAAASTIQRIDQPLCGTDPIGPGGMTICLAGMLGGLLTGLGLIWLLEPVKPTSNRRWSDGSQSNPHPLAMVGMANAGGRRQDDRFGRRATDWIESVWPGGKPNGDGAQTAPPTERRRRPQQPSTSKTAGKQPTGEQTPVQPPKPRQPQPQRRPPQPRPPQPSQSQPSPRQPSKSPSANPRSQSKRVARPTPVRHPPSPGSGPPPAS